MCGIVGFVGDRGDSSRPLESVRRMAGTIVHRGPDDEGFWDGGHVAIGMRRLSIIDLSGGHQPIANEDETVWVVCNGEIYNFEELRTELQAAGHRFRTGSDVEVLVHLYEEHGDSFLERVSGMFGAALWDTKRGRLTLVRDRLGIKPVYYATAGGRLAFGSEAKALLQLPWVDRTPDREALREYLGLGYAVAPRTLFRGIRKLPPATRLVWEAGSVRVESYWEPPTTTRSFASIEDCAAMVRTGLDRAVREHMVSDVPIGAFLSGGMDSSAVVAIMAKYSDRPVNTYSIGYAGGGVERYYNELSYAAAVAKRYGTHHTEIPVAPHVARLLPKLIWHLEEPVSDSATITTYLVSELAAQSVKVILSGVGGDELFAGYRRYLGDHYGRLYQRLPGWLRHGVLGPVARRLPAGRQNRFADLARYARRFIEAGELDSRERYRRYVEICARDTVAELLLVPGAPAVGGGDGFDAVAGRETSVDPLLALLRIDWQTQLSEDLLLLTDKITMATSIECRVPFLDHTLVEAAAAIPAALKLPGGELKGVLRRSLEGLLPAEVLSRSKRGFGAPVGSWFKDQLRPLRAALLRPETVAARGLLEPRAVAAVVEAHDAGREDYSDLLLVLMNLELWCRVFQDGRSDEDVASELAALAPGPS